MLKFVIFIKVITLLEKVIKQEQKINIQMFQSLSLSLFGSSNLTH
jgi:hypothetical protein